jgi:AcrR family transcriptional regulator
LGADRIDHQLLIERCLAAFVAAGSLELSIDRLAAAVKVSKRMLIHYFGNREALELAALTLLEERLRAQFASGSLPRGLSPRQVIQRLWDQTTAPESHGSLLLIMDIARRASKGSGRARQFYAEQLQLWRNLLSAYLPSRSAVDTVLQSFQGAVFEYLVTGDRDAARSALLRATARETSSHSRT